MRSFLSDPRIDNTIFEPQRDPAVFAQARVAFDAIQCRTAPISLRMRCIMPFANIAFGFWTDTEFDR
jgi:hypothetical protein